jgi:hypothetical protein
MMNENEVDYWFYDPDEYAGLETKAPVKSGDKEIPAGTRLIDLFPTGIIVTFRFGEIAGVDHWDGGNGECQM